MLSIDLINMPFASLARPSIALTQLKAVVEQRFPGQVRVRILYLNQDFGRYMPEIYDVINEASEATNSGFGDWFFRQVAFPGEPDNTEPYVRRYFRPRGPEVAGFVDLALVRRRGLDTFLDSLIARYDLGRADVVGFTSMFSQNVACFAIARKLKAKKPGLVTLMGGANCETPMGEVIARHVDAMDFVFSGPALSSFPQLIGALLAGDRESASGIKGVFSRESLERGPLAPAERVGEELSIDEEVPLDYDEFLATLEQNFPDSQVAPQILFETSRGCWWGERAHCTFCGLNGMTMAYRSMNADRAVRLIQSLFRYAGKSSFFESVDNILPREYLTSVLPRLETPPDVRIFYEVKADLKPAEMAILARAGVTEIQPGIEALATSTLKLMRKGTTSFQNLRFLQNCLVYGINPGWNLLVGFPGEGADVYRKYIEDIPLLVHLPPPSGVFPVRFDRFSPYFTQAQSYGLDLTPCDFYRFVYPFPEEALDQLAYFFIDKNFEASYISNMVHYIGAMRDRVAQWRALWEGQGNARPRLAFAGGEGATTIHDSRSGRSVLHDVGPVGARVLRLLEQQRRLRDIAERMADVADFDVERQIAVLQQHGLIFQEGDQVSSLVTPDDSAVAAAVAS